MMMMMMMSLWKEKDRKIGCKIGFKDSQSDTQWLECIYLVVACKVLMVVLRYICACNAPSVWVCVCVVKENVIVTTGRKIAIYFRVRFSKTSRIPFLSIVLQSFCSSKWLSLFSCLNTCRSWSTQTHAYWQLYVSLKSHRGNVASEYSLFSVSFLSSLHVFPIPNIFSPLLLSLLLLCRKT